LARRDALATEADLREALEARSEAARVEARLAVGDLPAETLQRGESREARRPLRPTRGDRGGPQPGAVDGDAQRLRGPELGGRPPDLPEGRGERLGAVRAGDPVEGPRHRALRRGGGGDGVRERRPR